MVRYSAALTKALIAAAGRVDNGNNKTLKINNNWPVLKVYCVRIGLYQEWILQTDFPNRIFDGEATCDGNYSRHPIKRSTQKK